MSRPPTATATYRGSPRSQVEYHPRRGLLTVRERTAAVRCRSVAPKATRSCLWRSPPAAETSSAIVVMVHERVDATGLGWSRRPRVLRDSPATPSGRMRRPGDRHPCSGCRERLTRPSTSAASVECRRCRPTPPVDPSSRSPASRRESQWSEGWSCMRCSTGQELPPGAGGGAGAGAGAGASAGAGGSAGASAGAGAGTASGAGAGAGASAGAGAGAGASARAIAGVVRKES